MMVIKIGKKRRKIPLLWLTRNGCFSALWWECVSSRSPYMGNRIFAWQPAFPWIFRLLSPDPYLHRKFIYNKNMINKYICLVVKYNYSTDGS